MSNNQNNIDIMVAALTTPEKKDLGDLYEQDKRPGSLQKQRHFLLISNDQRTNSLIMAIGDKVTGVGSTIKGFDCRGVTWLKKIHECYSITILTTHPVLGRSRCLNPKCVDLKRDRMYHSRDVISSVVIGLSAMTKLILKKYLPPFTQKIYPQ
ncbi:hypothetical protein BD770DRAFT_407228 [Pilaira anomala]|nr:hypothetical protein BD770DRAFT_407228 [Pilaira anomala]